MDGTMEPQLTAGPMQQFLTMFHPESVPESVPEFVAEPLAEPLAEFDAGCRHASGETEPAAGRSSTVWLTEARRQQHDLLIGMMTALFKTIGEISEPGAASACTERLVRLACGNAELGLLGVREFIELSRRVNQDVCAQLLHCLTEADASPRGQRLSPPELDATPG